MIFVQQTTDELICSTMSLNATVGSQTVGDNDSDKIFKKKKQKKMGGDSKVYHQLKDV